MLLRRRLPALVIHLTARAPGPVPKGVALLATPRGLRSAPAPRPRAWRGGMGPVGGGVGGAPGAARGGAQPSAPRGVAAWAQPPKLQVRGGGAVAASGHAPLLVAAATARRRAALGATAHAPLPCTRRRCRRRRLSSRARRPPPSLRRSCPRATPSRASGAAASRRAASRCGGAPRVWGRQLVRAHLCAPTVRPLPAPKPPALTAFIPLCLHATHPLSARRSATSPTPGRSLARRRPGSSRRHLLPRPTRRCPRARPLTATWRWAQGGGCAELGAGPPACWQRALRAAPVGLALAPFELAF
jgi:hypothetical protein